MPKPRQRKRPRAESVNWQERYDSQWKINKNLVRAHDEMKDKFAAALREQEKLRAQLANSESSERMLWKFFGEHGPMLDVLSHALDRANVMVYIERQAILRQTAELRKQRTELSAANSRIAELTGTLACGHPKSCWQNWNVPGYGHCLVCQANDEKEAAEARIARLTAEKSALDADCAKIRGERDRLIVEFNLPVLLSGIK